MLRRMLGEALAVVQGVDADGEGALDFTHIDDYVAGVEGFNGSFADDSAEGMKLLLCQVISPTRWICCERAVLNATLTDAGREYGSGDLWQRYLLVLASLLRAIVRRYVTARSADAVEVPSCVMAIEVGNELDYLVDTGRGPGFR